MKTFEEKWTAWLDDQLTGRELADFEAALPDKAAALAEKHGAKQLGALLKAQIGAPAFANGDFFNHGVVEAISRGDREPARHSGASLWWSIPRLFAAGATSLAIFVICAVLVIDNKRPAEQSTYLSQVLNARFDPVTNPNATVSIFESKEDKVTVIWVDGLQSLPSEFAAK